jgi:phage terminase small subunit
MTPKQEAFCLTYVECGNASAAYRRVYDVSPSTKPETISRKAKELLDHGKISARIAELQAEHRERHNVEVSDLTRELEADRVLARDNGSASAAISATLAIARIHGLADRGKPINFDLPHIDDTEDALDAMAHVIDGVAKGKLTPDEGKAVSGLIETYRRTMETAELEKRIAALEEVRGAKST